MPLLHNIDARFFSESLDFGRHVNGIQVGGNERGDVIFDTDNKCFKAAIPRLNQVIDAIASGKLKLKDQQVVFFARNCQNLNRKVANWNNKVQNSYWVGFLNVICWLVTASCFKYRKSLIAPEIQNKKIEKINEDSKVKLADLIRACAKGHIGRKPLHARMEKLNKAATRIQATWKRHVARKAYMRLLVDRFLSAIKIQSLWRMHSARKKFLAENNTLAKKSWRFLKKGASFVAGNLVRGAAVAGRMAVRHGPRLVVNYGMSYAYKAALAYAAASMGLNPADVLLQDKIMRYTDKAARVGVQATQAAFG